MEENKKIGSIDIAFGMFDDFMDYCKDKHCPKDENTVHKKTGITNEMDSLNRLSKTHSLGYTNTKVWKSLAEYALCQRLKLLKNQIRVFAIKTDNIEKLGYSIMKVGDYLSNISPLFIYPPTRPKTFKEYLKAKRVKCSEQKKNKKSDIKKYGYKNSY